MTSKKSPKNPNLIAKPSRRDVLKTLGGVASAATVLTAAPGFVRFAQATSHEPIKLGLQIHRTGIGAAYGRWYERVANAAVAYLNEQGGINKRQVRLITEDDGTDAARGAAMVEKFSTAHKVDAVFGTLFSHVVVSSSVRAGELKMPYFIVGETNILDGKFSRYVFQPGITNVRSQVQAITPFVAKNLGKKVTMIFPDYSFGYEHRDFFSAAIAAQGGEVVAKIAIPPTASSFTNYFTNIPKDTDVIYHVMVGPGVLTFVKELGEFYNGKGPKLFGFVDSIEAVDVASPGLEHLNGSHFWESYPRYAGSMSTSGDGFYRKRVGIDGNGASVSDKNDISTASHMFGVWETLFAIKTGMEKSGYVTADAAHKKNLVEAMESLTGFKDGNEHPQGEKVFIGKYHQVFGNQYVSQVKDGKLVPIYKAAIKDSLTDSPVDFTKLSL